MKKTIALLLVLMLLFSLCSCGKNKTQSEDISPDISTLDGTGAVAVLYK